MAPGAGLLAGRALRGGRWSLLGLALVVALGGGASITAAVAAYRTDHAYGDYVHDAAIGDLVLNPSIRTKEIDEAIRGFDGVETVRADTLLLGSVVATGPIRIADVPEEDTWLQVRGSMDGRYVDVDRPAVSEGRVPSGEGEVFVSSDYHAELERILDRPLAVGDHIDVGFFWGGLVDGEVDPNTVAEPLGVESLRISGFGLLPNEVLPEELFPRQQIIVSEDVTARYSCLESLGDATTFDEVLRRLLPEDCTRQLRVLLAHAARRRRRRRVDPPPVRRGGRPAQPGAAARAQRAGHRLLLHLPGPLRPRRRRAGDHPSHGGHPAGLRPRRRPHHGDDHRAHRGSAVPPRPRGAAQPAGARRHPR